jgi:hypothetical protein
MREVKPPRAFQSATTVRLPPEQRGGREWSYCLLGETLFYQFRDKGATMEEILQFSRVRAQVAAGGMLFD